ncbi:sensor histidine kinase [Nitratireductor rhodophyticola]|uniref:sensor histidine kinase n=1 Tax=Nitratireductor rhodophyticola TaxID=2854036 RepID=UPI002AC8C44A|nr:sensor histidine kinase [Nitratireductor rhodophyticola]WPZ15053.1 sensor histidine kinase [Nitratireductor rhodophyticola]
MQAKDSAPSETWSERIRAFASGPKPIGFFLFLLIAVTIIPAIGVSVVLLQRNNEAQREVVTTLAEAMAGSIAEAVDRELSGMSTTLRVLSTTPSLASGDLKDFYDRARLALAGSGSYLRVLDENYRLLINTGVPFGEPLTPLNEPETARAALKGGVTITSGVFFGKLDGKWSFKVVKPYFPENGPPRILVMTRNADTLVDVLSQQMLRGGWNASVVDKNNIVVASSFMSSDVGKTFFLNLDGTGIQHEAEPAEGREGGTYTAIIGESGVSGWKAVVWASTKTIEEPMRHSLRMLLAGGLLVIAIGAFAAWLLGRQIAGPVRRLARDARRLGAGEPVHAIEYPIAEVATVSSALAEAALDREQAENEIRLLMREVAHRSKNQLTVVSSMAKQTARSSRTFAGFQDAFQKRLHGLARSTDLLIAGGAAGVELRELLAAQVDPFRPDSAERLKMTGPKFRLANQPAQTVGLAVHELATNASKYGAFSTSTGRLEISWKVKDDILTLTWREHVSKGRRRNVRRRGFGTEIIERMVGGTLDAEISRVFHRDGLECVFRIPVDRLVPDYQKNPSPTGEDD